MPSGPRSLQASSMKTSVSTWAISSHSTFAEASEKAPFVYIVVRV